MWVTPQARGTGVGVALTSSVITWARVDGYRAVRLDAADMNTHAVRLYERIGFMSTDVISALPPPRAHLTEHERILDLSGL
jgi:ribosomal protein S18 acetylase RimI-like enzyme